MRRVLLLLFLTVASTTAIAASDRSCNQLLQGSKEISQQIDVLIAKREKGDPKRWEAVAAKVAELKPDYSLLLEKFRKHPRLFVAYFASDKRTLDLAGRTADKKTRTSIAFASGLTQLPGHPTDIRKLVKTVQRTALDHNHEMELWELYALRYSRDIENKFDELPIKQIIRELSSPAMAAHFLQVLIDQGALRKVTDSHRPFRREWSDWTNEGMVKLLRNFTPSLSREEQQKIFARFLRFVVRERLPVFIDPSETFSMKLTEQESLTVRKALLPGQLAWIKSLTPEEAVKLLKDVGGAIPWLQQSLSLPELADILEVPNWVAVAKAAFRDEETAKEFLLSPKTLHSLARHYGTKGFAHVYDIRSFFDLSLNDDNGPRSVVGFLNDFSKRFPEILSPELLKAVTDFSGDRDTIVNLINQFLIKRTPESDFSINTIIATALDVPAEQAVQLSNKESGRRLLGVVSEFMKLHRVNVLSRIDLSEIEKIDVSALAQFLSSVRNAYFMDLAVNGHTEDGKRLKKLQRKVFFDQFWKKHFGKNKIHHDQVPAATEAFKKEVLDQLNSLLAAGDFKMKISEEELAQLNDEWLDAEPLITTFARLSDPALRVKDKKTRMLLLETFKSSLEGRFTDYKFRSEEAQKQISFLTKPELDAWTKKRVIVRVAGGQMADPSDMQQQVRRRLQQIVETNVLPHFREFFETAKIPSRPELLTSEVMEKWRKLLTSESKADPIALLSDALSFDLKSNPKGQGPLARALIEDGLAALEKSEELPLPLLKNVVWFMTAINRTLLSEYKNSHEHLMVSHDLRNLYTAFPRQDAVNQLVSKGLVATAFDHSPRLLLSVGDLVNTACCMNYQAGGKIRALPGYLVDANIQAMVSWHLTQSHFDSFAEFKEVLTAMSTGVEMESTFDGNKKAFVFTLRKPGSHERVIVTRALGYAFLRQIVRIGEGTEDGKVRAAVLPEREYMQPHPLMSVMQENHAQIIDELKKELHSTEQRPFRFPKSRNPDGVYCDSCRDIQTDEYTVN